MGSRSRTGAPLNRKKKEQKINKVKRENLKLRNLAKRQRRDLKVLRGMLISVKRALVAGDVLRAAALIPDRIKHPPAELSECHHEFSGAWVQECKYCKEIWHE